MKFIKVYKHNVIISIKYIVGITKETDHLIIETEPPLGIQSFRYENDIDLQFAFDALHRELDVL